MVWGILPVLGVPAINRLQAVYSGITVVVNRCKNANGLIVHANRATHTTTSVKKAKNEEDSDRDAEAEDDEEAEEGQTGDMDGDVKMEDDGIYNRLLERHAGIRKERFDVESLVRKPSSGLMLYAIS